MCFEACLRGQKTAGGLGGAQPPPPHLQTQCSMKHACTAYFTLKHASARLWREKKQRSGGVGGGRSPPHLQTHGAGGLGGAQPPPFANTMLVRWGWGGGGARTTGFNKILMFCSTLARLKTNSRGVGGGAALLFANTMLVRWVSTRGSWSVWGGGGSPPPFANTRLARRVSTRFICFAARLHGKNKKRGGWGGGSPLHLQTQCSYDGFQQEAAGQFGGGAQPPSFANTRLARRVSTRFICFCSTLAWLKINSGGGWGGAAPPHLLQQDASHLQTHGSHDGSQQDSYVLQHACMAKNTRGELGGLARRASTRFICFEARLHG